MPTFIGLDLAWSPNKESGICWLVGDSAENLTCERLTAAVFDMEKIAKEIDQVEGTVVATIDAPVLYSPERNVEREIAKKFGKFKASAHSPHPHVKAGRKAGIVLGRALRERDFTRDPTPLLNGQRPTRTAVEVYPHTIHVRLFRLCERLKYKKGRVAEKKAGLLQYQWHLEELIGKEAPNVLECADVQRALHHETAVSARGKSLKRLDDTLDGLTCALAAWLMWSRPKEWEMIGDCNGYIVAPRETQRG